MKNNRFLKWMYVVDDDLLEEAQQPIRKKVSWKTLAGGIAACLVVTGSIGLFLQNKEDGKNMITNPVMQVSAAELEKMGYNIPLPTGTQNETYFLINTGQETSASMAQVKFEIDGCSYTCRALKTEQPEDISGIYAVWDQSMEWNVAGMEMQMYQSDKDTAWVGWYTPDTGIQWCLSGEKEALSLLHTAQEIVEELGYDLTVAPENAVNVIYNAFELNGLAIGETVFELDGTGCSYRMAATGIIEENFADISGIEDTFSEQSTGSVGWCTARISFDEGGAGKIVWFDVAPGLLYSFYMESGASEAALLEMASLLFDPAQEMDSISELEPQDTTSTEPPSLSASETITVTPLPLTIDMQQLDNCTLAISLEEGAIYKDDAGVVQMDVTIFAYDLYDMVDISLLKEGDRIMLRQKEVVVSNLERGEDGSVNINGGLDAGGYSLRTDGNTTFYEYGYSDVKSYYELGKTTIAVSEEFIYTDASDLDNDELIYHTVDLLSDSSGIDYHFNPNNTTITVRDGVIIEMNRVYTP